MAIDESRWINGVASFDFAQDETLFIVPSTIFLMLSEVEARTAFMQRGARSYSPSQ
jgi:hypothetical protein